MKVNEETCKMGRIRSSHLIQKLQLQVIVGVRDSEKRWRSGDGNVGLKEDASLSSRNSVSEHI